MMLMKTLNKNTLQFQWVMAMIAIVSPIQPLIAQPVDQKEVNASVPNPNEALWQNKTLDLFEAHEKSLGEVIDQLRAEFHGLQIVTHGPVDEMRVDIELRSVGIQTIFKAIEINLSGHIQIKLEDENLLGVYAELPPSDKVILKAFSIAPYLERVREKIIEAEVPKGISEENLNKITKEIALIAMDRAQTDIHQITIESLTLLSEVRRSPSKLEAPKLSFHPRSELLIVVGKTEAVGVAGQIITALNGQP